MCVCACVCVCVTCVSVCVKQGRLKLLPAYRCIQIFICFFSSSSSFSSPLPLLLLSSPCLLIGTTKAWTEYDESALMYLPESYNVEQFRKVSAGAEPCFHAATDLNALILLLFILLLLLRRRRGCLRLFVALSVAQLCHSAHLCGCHSCMRFAASVAAAALPAPLMSGLNLYDI